MQKNIPWSEKTQGLDDVAARRALATQRHRVRLLGVACGGLILLMALMLVNVRNPKNPVDQAIWDAFVSHRAGWLDPIVEFFTKSFGTIPDTVYAILAVLIIGIWRKSVWPLVTVSLSMILAPLCMVLIKNVLDRNRPPLIDRLVDETTFSFPSGHSTGVAALCVSIYLAMYAVLSHRARVITALILGVLAVTVAMSRLYVGVHWGTDVLAGLTLGTTVTCLVYSFFPKLMLSE